MRNKEPLLGFEVCVVLCRFDGYCRIVSMRERGGWVAGQGLYAGHYAMHCAQYAGHNTEDSMWGLYALHGSL